jgi:hypothetical protein
MPVDSLAKLANVIPGISLFSSSYTAEGIGTAQSMRYRLNQYGRTPSPPAPGLAGAVCNYSVDSLPTPEFGVGDLHIHSFEQMRGQTNAGHLWMVADRLWHNTGLTVTTTTAQTVNSVAWPARDRNGSTNGEGVMIGLEVTTATTNASAITNMTMSYTNQDGTAGRTATVPSFAATAVAGYIAIFNLAAGDTGVRSIQSITFGTSLGGGAVQLMAFRPVTFIPMPDNLTSEARNCTPFEIGLPHLWDNADLMLIGIASSAIASGIEGGSMNFVRGS